MVAGTESDVRQGGSGHDYPIVGHPVVRTHRETGRNEPQYADL